MLYYCPRCCHNLNGAYLPPSLLGSLFPYPTGKGGYKIVHRIRNLSPARERKALISGVDVTFYLGTVSLTDISNSHRWVSNECDTSSRLKTIPIIICCFIHHLHMLVEQWLIHPIYVLLMRSSSICKKYLLVNQVFFSWSVGIDSNFHHKVNENDLYDLPLNP